MPRQTIRMRSTPSFTMISMETFMPSNFLTRRTVLGGLLASAAVLLMPRSAAALTTAEAETLIGAAVRDITTVINSGKSEQAMYGDFERIFQRYADVPTIARSALGPPARSASSSQLSQFSSAFTSYLART